MADIVRRVVLSCKPGGVGKEADKFCRSPRPDIWDTAGGVGSGSHLVSLFTGGETAPCKKSEVCHEKTDLKVFVVVVPKEGWARPRTTPTFREYNLWCQQSQVLKSRCHTKRRMGKATRAHPSFGMTMTKTLRCVFSCAHQVILVIISLQMLCGI